MKLKLEFDHEELKDLNTSIIVESWDRKWKSLSFKRKLKETFTDYEIRKIRQYYKIFYDWYLVKGIPQSSQLFSMKDYNFIQNVVYFFATN